MLFRSPTCDVLARAGAERPNGKSSITASARALGLSKTQYTALRALVSLIAEQPADFPPVKQVSSRLLISTALAALPRNTLADETAALIPPMLNSLRCELALIDVRVDAYEHGGSLNAPEEDNVTRSPSVEHADNCLYVIGALVIGAEGKTVDITGREAFARELSAQVAFATVVLRDQEVGTEERHRASLCLCAALRLMTILSLRDDGWCGILGKDVLLVALVARTAFLVQEQWAAATLQEVESKSRSELKQESDEVEEADRSSTEGESTELFDLLCLALGACMRWATTDGPASQALYRDTRSSTECIGTRPCARRCSCRDPPTLLEGLAQLYVQARSSLPSDADAEEDSPRTLEQRFVRGYVAVLLGVLVQQDDASERIVLSALQSTMGGPPATVLANDCRVFVELYQQVNAQLVKPSSGSGEGSPGAADEGGGEEIAREAIRVWERVRDR